MDGKRVIAKDWGFFIVAALPNGVATVERVKNLM